MNKGISTYLFWLALSSISFRCPKSSTSRWQTGPRNHRHRSMCRYHQCWPSHTSLAENIWSINWDSSNSNLTHQIHWISIGNFTLPVILIADGCKGFLSIRKLSSILYGCFISCSHILLLGYILHADDTSAVTQTQTGSDMPATRSSINAGAGPDPGRLRGLTSTSVSRIFALLLVKCEWNWLYPVRHQCPKSWFMTQYIS